MRTYTRWFAKSQLHVECGESQEWVGVVRPARSSRSPQPSARQQLLLHCAPNRCDCPPPVLAVEMGNVSRRGNENRSSATRRRIGGGSRRLRRSESSGSGLLGVVFEQGGFRVASAATCLTRGRRAVRSLGPPLLRSGQVGLGRRKPLLVLLRAFIRPMRVLS